MDMIFTWLMEECLALLDANYLSVALAKKIIFIRIHHLPKVVRLADGRKAAFKIKMMYRNQLADMHEVRISKSGVNHRLKKLIEIADQI